MVYADDISLLGDSMNTIKESTEILLEASRDVGVETNEQKTKYVIMSPRPKSGQNQNIKIANESFENVGKLKMKIYKTVILPVVLHGCETWSLTLRQEHRLRISENRVLRKIFGPKREEDGSWRKLHNDELHSLYSSHNIVRVIKSRRMRWAGHLARMGEGRGVYRVLVQKSEGKRPLGRPRRRWEDTIRWTLERPGSIGRTGFGWLRIGFSGGLL
jgi:hypothetical protein